MFDFDSYSEAVDTVCGYCKYADDGNGCDKCPVRFTMEDVRAEKCNCIGVVWCEVGKDKFRVTNGFDTLEECEKWIVRGMGNMYLEHSMANKIYATCDYPYLGLAKDYCLKSE